MKRLTEDVIPRSGVTGIVVHGSGRHFSSGADLDDLVSAIRDEVVHACQLYEPGVSAMLVDNLKSFSFFDECGVPVVAAINGVCLGSALELALFCHCRICGAGSVLGLPESTFGLLPGCGGIQKLSALAGRSRAMELILAGNTFTPEEALEWHIVDCIMPREKTISKAIDFIRAVGNGYCRDTIGGYIKKYLR